MGHLKKNKTTSSVYNSFHVKSTVIFIKGHHLQYYINETDVQEHTYTLYFYVQS